MNSDIRNTPLYKEAEAIFAANYKPGSGRVTGAVDAHAAPDGRRIAFAGVLLDKLEGVPTTRICLLDTSSGALRVATFGPNTDANPLWSPRGQTIAFRSDRSRPGNFQLYLLDPDSGEVTAAPEVDGWIEYLAWSPDGARLLMGVAGHGADISGGEGAKPSVRVEDAERPAWIPNVEVGNEDFRRRSLWIYDAASHSVRKLPADGLNIWEAAWCGPERIAAIASPGAEEADWYSALLHLIDLADDKASVIFEAAPGSQLGCVSATPSGAKVAVVEAVCSDRWIVAGDLRVIDVTSGRVNRIDTVGADITHTEWRDEQTLALAGIRAFESVIQEYEILTDRSRDVWASDKHSLHMRYPRFSLMPGNLGGYLAIAMGYTTPAELAVIGDGGYRGLHSFAHAGTDSLGEELGDVRPYVWTAPDGLEIHGWLMTPRKGAAPYPLVMDVHGGPVWRWGPIFQGRMAHVVMLARRGYAVFWPNPRGSSGRGQDFIRHVFGDMGGKDTQDYLSGLDKLVADGIADPNRLGVTGGSYGGFMTSWLITQDQRFAAAVPVAPVTDWISQHFVSNIPHFDKLFLKSDYRDRSGNHYNRSPIMFADRVTTPTLNICGALDTCTPAIQAREFHNALRIYSKAKSVLVTYPQEGHGVRSFPGMIDYAARLVGWFEQYME